MSNWTEEQERPGWAPTCTCGKTRAGYFCHGCMAWAGASYGDQSSWSAPREEQHGHEEERHP